MSYIYGHIDKYESEIENFKFQKKQKKLEKKNFKEIENKTL